MYVLPSQTQKGVRYLLYAAVTGLVAGVAGVVLDLAIVPLFLSLPPGSGFTIDPAFLMVALTVEAAGCGIDILLAIALAFGVLGFVALRDGAMEFGPERTQRMDRVLVVGIIGGVLPLIGAFYGGATSFASITASFGSTVSLVAQGLGIAGALLLGLAALWAVESLVAPAGRTHALLALAMGVASGAAAIVLSLAVSLAIPTLSSFGDLVYFVVPAVVGGAVSIVSLALWCVVFRGVLNRFRAGELQPAVRIPYVPMYWPGYAPPYPPPTVPWPAYPPPPPAPPPAPPRP